MKKNKKIWMGLLAIVLLTSLVINLSVTLNTPLIFGDEGYYAAKGEWIGENLKIPDKLRLHTQSEVYWQGFMKTPFIMFLVAFLNNVGGGFLIKFLMPVIGVISAIFIFLLGKELSSTRAGVLASVLFLSIPSFITYSIFLYPEALAVMFVTVSFYFLFKYLKNKDKTNLIISGIMAGFAGLTEASSIIIFLVFIVLFAFYRKNFDYKTLAKNLVTLLLIGFVVISPWMLAHNYGLYGNPGYKLNEFIDFPDTEYIQKEVPDLDVGELKGPTESGRGTTQTLLSYGVLNYIQFSYSLVIFFFIIFGLSYLFVRKKKMDYSVILWALLFFLFTFYFLSGGRAEDVARNTLAVVAPLSLAGGVFVNKLYEYFKGTGRIGWAIGIIFVIIILGWSLFSAYGKAESLRPVKQFSPAFIEGCHWIKENTPEDALIGTLWGNNAQYHCKRSNTWSGAPGMSDAILAHNNSTYEIFKMHGLDYIYLQKFSIKQGKQRVSYPLSFVQYIESSDNYKKVYSYPQRCLYNPKINDCVVVYKVL